MHKERGPQRGPSLMLRIGYKCGVKPFSRGSLASRLLVTYAVTVLVVLAVLGFFVERAARETLLGSVESGLTEEARAIAAVLPEAPVEFVQDLSSRISARITIIDADGTVTADTHTAADSMENHADRPEVAAALAGEVGNERRVSESTGFPQTYVAVPVDDGRVVRLSLPENVVNEPIRRFRGDVLLIALAAAAAGVVIVALVARRLSRPLEDLSETASGVAGGDLEVEVPRSPIVEFDDLGRSIGTVATELGRRLDETESERRTLGVVLDALPQGTLLIDPADGIVYANQSIRRLLGPVPDTLDQVVPFRIQEIVRTARDTGEAVDVDAEHGRPVRILRMIASPFEDGRALVVVSDVTERRRVDDMRRDFVTNASHELKTPVASILASAETLQLALDRAPDRVPQFASQIETAARSLAQMVEDLLDLSRLEGHRAEQGDVDLATVVENELESLREDAERGDISVELELTPVTVRGSESDLGLAVRNLIENAIRYSEEGGRVAVRLIQAEGQAVLEVEDSGIGIPQRDLGRVFERFYRVDVGRSRATGGTGLGLSIVRHVVESHGGEVSVSSELGAGSTFTVRLPLAE